MGSAQANPPHLSGSRKRGWRASARQPFPEIATDNNHMKKFILIFVAVLVTTGAILSLRRSSKSTSEETPAATEFADPTKPTNAPAATALKPRDPDPIVNPTSPATNPPVQWLNTLYESPSATERLEAARQIAARGDETAFRNLATFIVAAEATGESSLLGMAQQVAAILGQMQGDQIQTIATELAYSPSALVAEAAVNAAVAAEAAQVPQGFEAGMAQNPADQNALDDYLQQLHQYDSDSLHPPGSE